VLFVIPSSSKQVYQALSDKYSGIGTPTWALLLAQATRSVGFEVGILDVLAERMSSDEAINQIRRLDPRLICFVVYGENVNSGTTQMSGAVELANIIKGQSLGIPISFIGSYVQALPYKVLNDEKSIDIIFTNEGVYALQNLLRQDLSSLAGLENVKGIGFRKDERPYLTLPERVVPQERMDADLPGYAWDLLPYKDRPLDLYRSPLWHADYDHDKRSPYAAIYTSLGCVFQCNFCMINMINRDDNEGVGVASNYNKMRFWSPDFIIKEFDKLVDMGVYTLRIADEMFLLNPKFYIPLCELLVDRGYGDKLNMWAYSRVDTVNKPQTLELIRKAGIRWLALGIESGDRRIRLEVSKGKFEDWDIREIVEKVNAADINIIGNYLFGLPGDDLGSMQKTLDLSKDLLTLAWNAYAVMPLPGSQLYKDAITKGYELPSSYAGYSFHSYETKPMPTEYLSSEEILAYRDRAFYEYHSNPDFLAKVKRKFGGFAYENIINMKEVRLKRKILGD